MKVYYITYMMKDKEYTCGILADSNNDAVTFLRLLYPNKIKNIVSISSGSQPIHAITDSIINRILVKYGHRDEETINPIIKD